MFEDFLGYLEKENKEFLSPEVAVFGRSVVVISHHRGFLRVTDSEVSIKVRGGMVKVVGKGLRLYETTINDAEIVGKIEGISYV